MARSPHSLARRTFLKTAAAAVTVGAGLTARPEAALASSDSDVNLIGPKEGYSPQIGTLVSMLTWMRSVVLRSVSTLKQPELDFLIDGKANTIGALLMHLAATETYYQLHTFGGAPWGKWPDAVKQKWDAASTLGDVGRNTIKGNGLDYYLGLLKETREKTLAELRKRDDKWLATVDKEWPWGPTNNYCKWFHVCEHESNHNGQIKFLKGRLPGARPAGE